MPVVTQGIVNAGLVKAGLVSYEASPLGPELVINGNFGNGDTGWTGLNVVNGVANTISTRVSGY